MIQIAVQISQTMRKNISFGDFLSATFWQKPWEFIVLKNMLKRNDFLYQPIQYFDIKIKLKSERKKKKIKK